MPSPTTKSTPRPANEAALQAVLNRLPEPIRRQWKQAAVLTVLLSVLAGLGVSRLGGKDSLQKSANSTSVTPETRKSGASANNAGSTRGAGAADGVTLAARLARADKLERWLAGSVDVPSRNVFAIDLKRYPRVEGFADSSARGPGDIGGFWDRVRKSLEEPTDDRQRQRDRQDRLDRLLRSAAKLNLQSTMTRSKPALALVGGRLCRVGDAIESGDKDVAGDRDVARDKDVGPEAFVLRSIEDGRIVVEREGVKIAIYISGPQRVALVE